MLMLTRIFGSSISVSSKCITSFAFLLWLTAFYLIQFLPLKLVTDTEPTCISIVTMDVLFALSFDFQTSVSARNITTINFRSYCNKKTMIVIILGENIFSIFLRLSLFILSKWIYVKVLPVHFASKLSSIFECSCFSHTFFKKKKF